MQEPIKAKSAIGPWIRAVLLTILLIGSLLPDTGASLVLFAAAALVPLVAWTIIRGLPTLCRSACLVILLVVPLAIAVSLQPPTTEYGYKKVTAFFTLTLLTMLAAVAIRDRRDLNAFAMVWIGAGALLAVLALTGTTDAAGRAAGNAAGNPIWLGRAIGSPIIALVWLSYQRHIRIPWAAAIGALLSAGLLATGSRGPFVAVAVGAVLAIAVSSARQRIARALLTVAYVAVALYLALSLNLVYADSRIGVFLRDPIDNAADAQRVDLARPTLNVIAAHPAGVGLGNWREHVPTTYLHRYPHNLWLEVLAEAGWAVGALLLAVVAWVLVRLWRASRANPAAALALTLLAGEIVFVSVSGDLNARTLYFTLTLGYAVSWWPTRPPGPEQPGEGAEGGRVGSTRRAPPYPLPRRQPA